jgi:hypothetical protein
MLYVTSVSDNYIKIHKWRQNPFTYINTYEINERLINKLGMWRYVYDFDVKNDTIVLLTGNRIIQFKISDKKLDHLSDIHIPSGTVFNKVVIDNEYLYCSSHYISGPKELDNTNYCLVRFKQAGLIPLDTIHFNQDGLEMCYFSPFRPLEIKNGYIFQLDFMNLSIKTLNTNLNFAQVDSFFIPDSEFIKPSANDINVLINGLSYTEAGSRIEKLSSYFDKKVSKSHTIIADDSNRLYIMYDVKDSSYNNGKRNKIAICKLNENTKKVEYVTIYNDLRSINADSVITMENYKLALYYKLFCIGNEHIFVVENDSKPLSFPYNIKSKAQEDEKYFTHSNPSPYIFIYKLKSSSRY